MGHLEITDTDTPQQPQFGSRVAHSCTLTMSCLAKLGVTIPFDPQHAFVTSPVLSPLPLAIVRLVMAFYALFTIVFVLAWELNVTHVDT